MTLQEIYEQILFCYGYEDVCTNCEYNRAGTCNDMYDLLRRAAAVIEEALQNGMANN